MKSNLQPRRKSSCSAKNNFFEILIKIWAAFKFKYVISIHPQERVFASAWHALFTISKQNEILEILNLFCY